MSAASFDDFRKRCMACRLCAIGGNNVVAAAPEKKVRVMVVGQNPGTNEVESGVPFSGDEGIVRDIMAEMGLTDGEIYYTNVVKCHTPFNRRPHVSELSNCRMNLADEVRILDPEYMVAIGATAFKEVTGMVGLTKHCGEIVFSPRYRKWVLGIMYPSALNLSGVYAAGIYEGLAELRKRLWQTGS